MTEIRRSLAQSSLDASTGYAIGSLIRTIFETQSVNFSIYNPFVKELVRGFLQNWDVTEDLLGWINETSFLEGLNRGLIPPSTPARGLLTPPPTVRTAAHSIQITEPSSSTQPDSPLEAREIRRKKGHLQTKVVATNIETSPQYPQSQLQMGSLHAITSAASTISDTEDDAMEIDEPREPISDFEVDVSISDAELEPVSLASYNNGGYETDSSSTLYLSMSPQTPGNAYEDLVLRSIENDSLEAGRDDYLAQGATRFGLPPSPYEQTHVNRTSGLVVRAFMRDAKVYAGHGAPTEPPSPSPCRAVRSSPCTPKSEGSTRGSDGAESRGREDNPSFEGFPDEERDDDFADIDYALRELITYVDLKGHD